MAAGLLLVGLESMALNLSSGLGCRIWCLGFKVWRLGALGRGARNPLITFGVLNGNPLSKRV